MSNLGAQGFEISFRYLNVGFKFGQAGIIAQDCVLVFVRPGEICWKGVEDMCNILGQREISSDEALSLLKPYVKNNMPTVVLKALTVSNSFT